MQLFSVALALLSAAGFVAALPSASNTTVELTGRASVGHKFTFVNNCKSAVKPKIADTRCGYSPRCSDAAAFSGSQPASLAASKTSSVIIDRKWVGRVFNAANSKCGAKGESCTLTEFNLDTGDFYTPQAYDISNIQGFTQSISLGANGCDTVTCKNANCGCSQAYPVGDISGCNTDKPVRACGAGDIGFKIVFCP